MARVLMAFEPPDGGVAEHASQLARGLPEHGHEVVLAGPARCNNYPELEAAGVQIHRLPFERGYGNTRHNTAVLRGLTNILHRKEFDLVHCHSSKAGVLGRLAARRRRVPAIYSPNCFPFVGVGPPRRQLASSIERALAPLASAIVCVCEDERRLALGVGIAARRLEVIHNGSSDCDGSAEPTPELVRLRDGGQLAGALCALREQKTVDVLIDAAPLVLEQLPEARLAIVGDGPLEDDLRARAAHLGLAGDERFAMLPFSRPVAGHLHALDVFVLPSAYEALPIGVLEAMACGVPQVATDVGGTGEAVADGVTGLLVPPGDPESLARAIVELLRDTQRRASMAQASRERHARLFGVERMVAAHAQLYERVLASSV